MTSVKHKAARAVFGRSEKGMKIVESYCKEEYNPEETRSLDTSSYLGDGKKKHKKGAHICTSKKV